MTRTLLRSAAAIVAICAAAAGCGDEPTSAAPTPAPPHGDLTGTMNPSRDPASPFGVNINLIHDPVTGPTLMDHVRDAGIRWVRMSFEWEEIQRGGPDSYNWWPHDLDYQLAQERNINIVGVLAYAPEWANGSPDRAVPVDAAHLESWRQFVAAAAARYPAITHWAVGNEPNCGSFYKGTWQQYAQLVSVAATELHRPSVQDSIVVGELAMFEGGDCLYGPEQWLANAINQVGPDSVDVLSLHIYGDASNVGAGVNGFASNMNAKIAGGLRPKHKIWLTEVGLGAPGAYNNETGKADHLKNVMSAMTSGSYTSRWTKTFYWHLWAWSSTNPADPSSPVAHEGILDGYLKSLYEVRSDPAAIQAMPAYAAYKGVIAGCQGCTAVHRLYNTNYNGHWDYLDTTDPHEGTPIGFVLDRRNAFWLDGVRRHLWNSRALYLCAGWDGWHHYVSTDRQCEIGGADGRLLGYMWSYQRSGTVPLYRTHRPTDDAHATTIHPSEVNARVQEGWVNEGVLGYVYP